jgi:hypothetical protein
MQVALLVWLFLLVFVGSRVADYLNRVRSPDFVAVAFGEGGDDAYYYFTIARNMAKGAGITIDGVHWTTGVQPLWQLVCGAAFLVGSDRGALALIYGISLACWLGGLFLFLRFVRRAAPLPLSPAMTALAASFFLCDVQLNSSYFNGMDTGLHLTLCLGLLVVFQRHLADPPPPAGLGRLVGMGILAGLTMLARNDAVFLCGALLALTLLPGRRPRPLREGLVIVATAAVLVLPWLIYCQLVWGNPMPQSGIATSTALYGHVPAINFLRSLVQTTVPTFFLKARTVVDTLSFGLAAAVAVAAALIAWWRLRDRTPAVEATSRLVLTGLAAASIPSVIYYEAVSSAGQFFQRYFAPIKLLVLILLALFVAHALRRLTWRYATPAIVGAIAVAAIGSNLYWTWRDYGVPYRSYIGYEAYAFTRSPLGQGDALIGAPESGRLGFLSPSRIVNLDGKMRVDALDAFRNDRLYELIEKIGVKYLLLSDLYVELLDKKSPGWRDHFKQAGTLGFFNIYERTPSG